MSKLAFMITCFDEVNAIDVALTSLRHHYPNEYVNVFCEGDAKDLLFLEKKHNVSVIQGFDSQSPLLKMSDKDYDKAKSLKVEKAVRILIDRINLTIEDSKADYILLHCPDTLIRGKFEIPEGSGLLGSCVNRYFFKATNDVLLKYGGLEVNYFGAVPAIFNTKDFLQAKSILEKNKTLIEELCDSSCYAFSHDIFMSIVFSLIGKREEHNSQIIECGRSTNWIESGCPIIHQFRTFYPKRTTKYKSQENA